MINKRNGRAAPSMRATFFSPRRARHLSRGQSLVEFSLVFPLFVTMIMALIEFSFVFNALLSVGHATRDSALVAAEAGNADSADCVVLRTIEGDIGAPADKARVQEVLIYRSDANGAVKNSNKYVRTGVPTEGPDATTCTLSDGSTLTVPYKATATGYRAKDRCNIVAGCPLGAPTQPLDTIGVKITYHHTWVTPLANLLNLGGGSGTTLVQSNTMRMEPVL
jgi:Flp pilus assembly protein TadG